MSFGDEHLKDASIENKSQSLLIESLNREKEMRRLLDEQLIKNDQLQLQLQMEKKKTTEKTSKTFLVSSESEESFSKSYNEIQLKDEDLTKTFGTNSSVLMQYRYDDLRQSYSKCVMKLNKKNKQMKKLLSETELLKFKNEQLSKENSDLNDEKLKLNKKIEEICFRFLNLIDRRSNDRETISDQFKSKDFHHENIKSQIDLVKKEIKQLEELLKF